MRKGVDQKVNEFCDRIYGSPADIKQMKKRLISLLKEQDRDTRHACAEAMYGIPSYLGADGSPVHDCRGNEIRAISADEAHSACMNARSV